MQQNDFVIKLNKNRDLTTGSITGGLWSFAVPLMLGNVFQQFYNLADTWMVGKYVGDNALAAVARLPLLVYGSGILLAQLSEKITNNYKWLQFTKIQLSRADYYTHFPHSFQQLLKKNGNTC